MSAFPKLTSLTVDSASNTCPKISATIQYQTTSFEAIQRDANRLKDELSTRRGARYYFDIDAELLNFPDTHHIGSCTLTVETTADESEFMTKLHEVILNDTR